MRAPPVPLEPGAFRFLGNRPAGHLPALTEATAPGELCGNRGPVSVCLPPEHSAPLDPCPGEQETSKNQGGAGEAVCEGECAGVCAYGVVYVGMCTHVCMCASTCECVNACVQEVRA